MTSEGLVNSFILIEVIKFSATRYMVCCFAFVNTSLSLSLIKSIDLNILEKHRQWVINEIIFKEEGEG